MLSNFNWEKAIAERPSFEQRDEFYGDYRFTEAGGGWVTPEGKWEHNNLDRIPVAELPGFPLLYGVPNPKFLSVRMHKKIIPIFRATWADLHELGLTSKLHSFDGCFAARHMQNNVKLPLSNHAKGSAIDFDQATNRMGIPFNSMGMVRNNMQFVIEMERRGWAWGGRWSYSDGMHFEWVDQDPRCTPPHQDAIARELPKANPNPRSIITPIEIEIVIVNGVVQPYEVSKVSQVGKKLYINTK